MRKWVLIVLTLLVSGCTPPLPASDMLPMTQIYSKIPDNPSLDRKVQLGDVTVYDNAGGMTAPVTVAAYREALQNALLTANFAVRGDNTGDALYRLDAHLLALDVPTFGFSMTASATCQYILKRQNIEKPVVDETVSIPYTAEFSESLNGAHRARLAVAKAIRENITHMLRILASKTPKELGDSQLGATQGDENEK